MTPDHSARAYRWADSVPSLVGCKSPPIDLHAVARLQRIKRAELRLMIHRGALVPVPGGFEVYLRALEPEKLNLDAPETYGQLTTRQRQAFAHEIAHTFFYKDSNGVPAPTHQVKNDLELEKICDRTGWHLLIPTGLLKAEINNKLGDCTRIDAHFIRTMKDKFYASPEVTLERVRVTETGNTFARCILTVRKVDGETKVTGSYFGLGLLSVIPELKANETLQKWFPEFPEQAINRDGTGRWEVVRRSRRLLIEKFPLGMRSDFLLQVDDLDLMA